MKSFKALFVAMLVYSCISFSTAFQARPLSTNKISTLASSLSRAQPLSTVNTGILGFIPRLEIGLRFRKQLPIFINYDDVKFINPLEFWQNANRKADRKNFPSVQIPSKLFRNAASGIVNFTNTFVGYLKKVMATSLLVASSFTNNPVARKFSMAAATTVAVFQSMPKIAHAGPLMKYRQLSPTQKLATTPLFFVCNTGGSPYLQEDIQAGRPDQRIVVYFMSSEDANDYLNEMAQGNPQNVNEFRIMATSMEKVVNKIQSRKQSRKMGRYPMSLVYRIQPSQRQCENAERVAGDGDASKGSAALKGLSIPMFTVKGMTLKRANGEIATPHYFAYEDLLEDLKSVVGLEGSGKPKVVVKDFVEVMCLSQGLNTNSLFAQSGALAGTSGSDAAMIPAVVPPKREITMLKKFYRNEAGVKGEFQTAKMMGQPR